MDRFNLFGFDVIVSPFVPYRERFMWMAVPRWWGRRYEVKEFVEVKHEVWLIAGRYVVCHPSEYSYVRGLFEEAA